MNRNKESRRLFIYYGSSAHSVLTFDTQFLFMVNKITDMISDSKD